MWKDIATLCERYDRELERFFLRRAHSPDTDGLPGLRNDVIRRRGDEAGERHGEEGTGLWDAEMGAVISYQRSGTRDASNPMGGSLRRRFCARRGATRRSWRRDVQPPPPCVDTGVCGGRGCSLA
jgi:hypothetical protein